MKHLTILAFAMASLGTVIWMTLAAPALRSLA